MQWEHSGSVVECLTRDRGEAASSPGAGEGYSDIFIHTSARVIFLVQNFEFQYFFGFSEEEKLGMKILWICFWGHHKIGLYLGVISMHFKVIS